MAQLNEALLAVREGRYDDAEALSRAILAATPEQWLAYVVLTECLLRRGESATADRLTTTLLAECPDQADLLIARATVVAFLNRQPEALDLLDRSLDRRLNNAVAHEMLSNLLAHQNDPRPRYHVTVITPSVGTEFLAQAVHSVQAQTYPFVEHLVVADGPAYHEAVAAALPKNPRHPVRFLPLPQNVGDGGYNGHRVYAAAPYLVNSRYVAFLDEDNWFDPDHIASLMGPITARGLAWGYALRKIVDVEGRFITNDDCESLGEWPTWKYPDVHLVDANCYVVRRDLALAGSPLWHRRSRDGQGADFAFCQMLLKGKFRCTTNGRYTVNYRAGRSPGSVNAEFFLQGNQAMLQRHGGVFPWRQKPSSEA